MDAGVEWSPTQEHDHGADSRPSRGVRRTMAVGLGWIKVPSSMYMVLPTNPEEL